MTRVLSGIQPTGVKHLGNYLGAIRWWVEDQKAAESFYCIVDLHAMTVMPPPGEVGQASLSMATLLLASGLDPDACTLFVQSHVPAHSQLSWVLECTASFGELERMTQFKDKTAKGGAESARAGLFTYPALMAADILLYDADRVPVGDDQRQHLELTRNLAERFNARYGETFVVPEASIPPPGRGARVMDLQDPTRKMSTTADSHAGVIFMLDDPAALTRKVMRAVTDSGNEVRYDRAAKPGVSNLLELLAVATGGSPEELAGRYEQYGGLKRDTAEAVVALLAPIQERYRELAQDPGQVTKVLQAGAERAAEVANATLARAYAAVGLLPA